MAEKPKGGFTTVYEGQDAGTVAFSRRTEIEADVMAYLEVVSQLKKDYAKEPSVVDGLAEIETQLKALRLSSEGEEELHHKLQSLIEVPLPSGKSLRLDAFRKKAAQTELHDDEEYRDRVAKLLRNTAGNITYLLLTWPDDTILQGFLKEVRGVDAKGNIKELKSRMTDFSKSPHLWHYNEKKKDFLVEWLRPYQEFFDKPIEELTEEDIQEAVQKVENLRNTKLEEMTNMVVEQERGPFRRHNRTMHPIMNGKTTDFWGSAQVREEFITVLNKLITRFSLNLEDRYLLFKTQDGGFCYLIGFADDAFDHAVETEDGGLGIFPHLKVFLRNQDGGFNEILPEAYGSNSAAYYRALKTAVVPFLTAMGVMVEHTLSPEIKAAFDMWA